MLLSTDVWAGALIRRAELEGATYAWASKIATQPRLGLSLTKTVVNRAQELQGLRSTMDMAFGYHHFAHAHSQALGAGQLGGQDAKSMVQANKAAETTPSTQGHSA